MESIFTWTDLYQELADKVLSFKNDRTHIEGDNFCFGWDSNRSLVLHEPWNDIKFMQQLYDSKLDFLIWVCIYKAYGTVVLKTETWFPKIVFLDLRYPRASKYIDYNYEKMTMG